MSRSVAASLVAGAALACAQPGTPPGGVPDKTPPRVIAVEPAAYDTLVDLDEPVVFRFDERISERLDGVAELRDAVVVSPATSPVKARRRRRSIEVSLVRGWEPGRVYSVEVRPLFRDLFGNRRVEPVRLVFSTGGSMPETAVAGFVSDRLTGRPAAGARVEARREAEPAPYVAIADSAGFFALEQLPPDAYRLTGWIDQDRDREADFQEERDTARAEIAAGDTVLVELAVLPGDSTPARLARAEPVDSLRVRLLFDDYFAVGDVSGQAALLRGSDSTRVAVVALVHGARLDSILAVEEAARDTAGPAADTLGAARDTLGARPSPGVGGRRGGEPPVSRPGEPSRTALPSQELIALLPVPLEPDSAYIIRVEGVTNIRGVPGGGGEARFVAPPPDTTAALAPDTIPADTIPADTIPADTIPADTAGAAAGAGAGAAPAGP